MPSDPTTVADILARRDRWKQLLDHAREHNLSPNAIQVEANRSGFHDEVALRGAFRECPRALPKVVKWNGKLWVYVEGDFHESGLREVVPVEADKLPLA